MTLEISIYEATQLLEDFVSDIEGGNEKHLDIYYAIEEEARLKFGEEFIRPYAERIKNCVKSRL